MKLLFLLDEGYAPTGPTIRFGRLLAATMAQLGNEVEILENLEHYRADYTDEDGIRHHAFRDTKERDLYTMVKASRQAGGGAFAMLKKALAAPSLLRTAFGLLVLKKSPEEGVFRRKLETLCQKERYDAVISVSAPHYTAMALAFSHFAGVKAAYMADPYASATVMRAISSPRRERRLYAALDVAVVTDLMYQHGLYPQEYRYKAVALHFPGIRPPVSIPARDDVVLEGEYINCLFVGNLYLDIRSPEFTFELFARLPKRYRLVLVGEGLSQFPPAFREKYEALLGERLLQHPPVSGQAAANLVQAADVLVNIGNTDPGQLPSKILDYISTGRPVLNVCKLADCPTLPYLRAYPLACNLPEAGGLTGETVARVTAFLEDAVGRRLPYDEVQALYDDHTPRAVAEKMLDAIAAQSAEKQDAAKGGRP